MTANLKLVEWNINRASVQRFKRQSAAISTRQPDILALVEVGIKAGPRAGELLADHGFDHVVFSQDLIDDEDPSASGVLFASCYPFEVMSPGELGVPIKHRALSAVFDTPFGDLEGHIVHIVPGSSNGWKKVEFFEGMYDRLARPSDRPRFLCGDFNSPKKESEDGSVEVFGHKRGERWVEAERSVITGLADEGLPDAYRAVHGYQSDASAWSYKNIYNGEVTWRRRFDHVFASPELNPTEATYLHDLDDHSDHTPLEVVFEPKIDHQTMPNSPMVGLIFDEDVRHTNPDATGHRRGRFKAVWRKAVDGADYGESTLERLTWQNLGWRLGKLFGKADDSLKNELYDWCVRQQSE